MCHNKILRFFPYGSPPDQEICSRTVMDLRAGVLWLFGKHLCRSKEARNLNAFAIEHLRSSSYK